MIKMRSFSILFVAFAIFHNIYCEVYLEEKFLDDSWEKNWIYSKHPGKEFGKFVRTPGKFYNDEVQDQGLQTSQDARFYALSHKFPPFSNEGKELVIQFSVKHEQNIDCGGGYIKVFDCKLNQEDMHGESPYEIMFGPDICGPSTKKVHVIFSYKGQNHLIKKDIRCKDDVYTHYYTLVVRPDNTYEVLIDGESDTKGSLEEDWDFLPPRKIKDPEAKKPEDWDDNEKIPDPDDKKPEDWDVPEHIPDPEATKPDDWDDEMDGEWEPPMIDNPEYKGVWTPKQINNPNFKGIWEHPLIDNPEFTADDNLYRRDEICAVGFDLWQVKAGTIFDNVLVTDDINYAKDALKSLKETQEGEKKMKEKQDEQDNTKEDVKDDDEDDEDESPKELPADEEEDSVHGGPEEHDEL
ncbi:calreticulin [Chrysoperla carnea]|uniref:calreticulin n=1 Tax=Chrysoperla carnea TaxID=189513 RepID=UPI001D061F4A|nr:calreticulin [Chrysoperla carnea]